MYLCVGRKFRQFPTHKIVLAENLEMMTAAVTELGQIRPCASQVKLSDHLLWSLRM